MEFVNLTPQRKAHFDAYSLEELYESLAIAKNKGMDHAANAIQASIERKEAEDMKVAS